MNYRERIEVEIMEGSQAPFIYVHYGSHQRTMTVDPYPIGSELAAQVVGEAVRNLVRAALGGEGDPHHQFSVPSS